MLIHTCNIKLKKTAIPAHSENVLTAGMVDIAPKRKAADSEEAVNNRDGATSANARPVN